MRSLAAAGTVATLTLAAAVMAVRGSRAEGSDRGPEGDAWVLPEPVGATTVGVPPDRPVLRDVMGADAAAETADGWVVLDRRGHRLVLLDRQGAWVRSAGRRGRGPGELTDPVAVAVAGERIVVAETDGRLLFFDPSGDASGEVRTAAPAGCLASQVRSLLDGVDSLPALTMCPRRDGRITARAELLALDGGRRLIAEAEVNDPGSGVVDPLRIPVLGRAGDHLAFGVLPDPCLALLDAEGATVGRVCYPDVPLSPFPDSSRVQLRLLEERLRPRGVRIRTPSHLPPFRGVLGKGESWGFMALLADGTEAVDRVEDGALHRTRVAAGVRAFLGERALLLARETLAGTSFAVVPLR